MALFKKDAPVEVAEPTAAAVWSGAEALRSLLVPVERLEPDSANTRKHPERNMEAIKTSLTHFGQRKPVVARNGKIIAGNGTLQAATALGWTHLAVVEASDLTLEQAQAYAIADNKTGDLAEWDFQELAVLFREMPEELLAATGFASFEIEPLLRADFTAPVVGEEVEADAAGVVTFRTTHDQAIIVNEAISRVRHSEADPAMKEGRALELICADFVAGSDPAK